MNNKKSSITKISWKEFQDSGMLWWTNRILHTFGLAIVYQVEEDGTISEVFPARVTFRGFDYETESNGFKAVTKWMNDVGPKLEYEIDK